MNRKFLFALIIASFLTNAINVKAKVSFKEYYSNEASKRTAIPTGVEKYYMVKIPLKDYKPVLANLFDINSLDVLFVISFENENTLKTVALVTINMDRLSSIDRGYVTQQALYVGEFLEYASYQYEIKDKTLIFNNENLRFDFNNQSLHNEKIGLKLDAYTEEKGKMFISSFSKNAIYILKAIGQNGSPRKYKEVLEKFINEPLDDFLGFASTSRNLNLVDEEKYITSLPDREASFPGGKEELKKYLGKKIKYPPIAQENGTTGIVLVQFTVTCEGTIKDVKVKRSVDPYLDKEAMRAVYNMPKWEPAVLNGEFVDSTTTIPITFGLN